MFFFLEKAHAQQRASRLVNIPLIIINQNYRIQTILSGCEIDFVTG
jgi:hypothetical protein